ncbi:MAG: hypothetical protein LH613_01030 [Chamaesiphon sp.]|nr:hypothetical protein [Chamaesiphon sp.]
MRAVNLRQKKWDAPIQILLPMWRSTIVYTRFRAKVSIEKNYKIYAVVAAIWLIPRRIEKTSISIYLTNSTPRQD